MLGVGLAAVLMRSAFAHVGNPYQFMSAVYAYQLLPPVLVPWLAAILPFLQLTVAVGLLFRWWPRENYLVAAGLFAAFTAGQAWAVWKGLQIPCGCFGTTDGLTIGRPTLALAALFLCVALLGFALTSAAAGRRPSAPWLAAPRTGFALAELLVVLAILGVLAALTLGAVLRVRDAAQRSACQHHLMQLGVALHHYHDQHRTLPPGCTVDSGRHPEPYMSWLTRLLPFLEHHALWSEAQAAYRLERHFQKAPHRPAAGRTIEAFLCPSDPRSATPKQYKTFRAAYTNFLGVEGTDQYRKDGLLFMDSRLSFAAVGDGLSHTLLVGERAISGDGNLGWWYAGWGQDRDGSAEMILGAREVIVSPQFQSCTEDHTGLVPGRADRQCDYLHFWSHHRGGASFLWADGSVRFLGYAADRILPALATRAGGEAFDGP